MVHLVLHQWGVACFVLACAHAPSQTHPAAWLIAQHQNCACSKCCCSSSAAAVRSAACHAPGRPASNILRCHDNVDCRSDMTAISGPKKGSTKSRQLKTFQVGGTCSTEFCLPPKQLTTQSKQAFDNFSEITSDRSFWGKAGAWWYNVSTSRRYAAAAAALFCSVVFCLLSSQVDLIYPDAAEKEGSRTGSAAAASALSLSAAASPIKGAAAAMTGSGARLDSPAAAAASGNPRELHPTPRDQQWCHGQTAPIIDHEVFSCNRPPQEDLPRA